MITFVVDPDVLKRVLKHGAQAVPESEPDLTKGYSQYILPLAFGILIDPSFRLLVRVIVERHV